eukprot:6706424-Prymnesium_polylepis.1
MGHRPSCVPVVSTTFRNFRINLAFFTASDHSYLWREIVGPPLFFRPLLVRRRTLRRCAPPARDIEATNERSGRARCAR